MKLNLVINILAIIFFFSCAAVFALVATKALNRSYESQVLGGYSIEEDTTVNLDELPETVATSLDSTVSTVSNITTSTSTISMFDEAFEWIDRPYRLLVIPQTYFEEDATFRKDITLEGGLEINDVDYIFPDEDNDGILTSDGQGNLTWEAIEAGITDFLGLLDTPNSYSGENSSFVAVNSTGTGLEFVDAPTGTTITGTDNRLARFNAAGDNVENSSINDLYTGGVALTVDSNARIGIGTTAPESLLTVRGGATIGSGYTGVGISAPTQGLLVQGRVGIGNTNPAYLLDVAGTGRTWNLITQNISLASLYSSTIIGNFGFGGFTNFTGGIGTGGMGHDSMPAVNRLTSTGNLQNIASVQAGEMHLTNGGTFVAGVGYTAGNGTRGLTIGDFNGDSDLDVAAANPSSNTVSIFLNNGDGTLAAKADYTATSAFMVTSGDFNGDGALDLASSDNSNLRISVLMNNGDGTYATEVTYAASVSPRGIVAGDVNGDGKADIAVTELAGNIAIYINNGNGTFASRVAYPATAGAFKIRMSDLNGDGYGDLTYSTTEAFIGVLINDGDGTFGSEITYATNASSTSYGVAVGDVNGDSMPDIVASNTGVHTVSVFINNGDGTFASDVEYATSTNPRGVSLGDITGDGKPDISVLSGGSSTLSVLINNGDGTFGTKVDYATANSSNFSVETGDFNGDGKADLVSSTLTSPGKVTVYMNTPSTMLIAKASTGYVGIGTSAPSYLLDVSGTGRVNEFITDSIILSSLYSNIIAPVFGFSGYTNFNSGIGTGGFDSLTPIQRLTVAGNLINIGSYQGGEMLLTNGGTFAAKVDYAAGSQPQSVDIGELNGDSYLDLVVDYGGGVSVFINDGDGTFATKVDYVADVQAVKIADLNGDGAADIAGAGGEEFVTVLLNDGDGTFAAAVDYPTIANSIDIAVGDLNGDGKPDLAAVENGGPSDLMVLMNAGDGTFGTPVNYVANSQDLSIEIADVDGDGWADVVASGSNNVSVFLNNGNGTLAAKVDYAVNHSYWDMKITDVNGDNKVDITGVKFTMDQMGVLINDGDGTFAAEVNYTTGGNPVGVGAGDFNGDGKADMVAVNTTPGTASVLMNNGNGTFATKVDYATGSDPEEAKAGDLNGDGKADFVVANRTSNTISVFINQTNPVVYAQASTGRVGIGTTGPGSKLSINGSVGIGSTYAAYAAPANGMLVQGAVGIGTTNAGSHALSVVGTAGLSTGTAWTNTSDQRFKDVQSEIKGSALDTLSRLRPVTYEWNELHNSMFGEDPGLNYGFIAQEIGEVIPEMVTQDAQGFYYYNPSGFESILTAAVQEQQDMIDEIRDRLDNIDTQSDESSEEPEENLAFDLSDHPVLEDLSEVLEVQETDEGGKRVVFFSDMNVSGNVTADSFSTLGEIAVGFLTIKGDDNSINVLGGDSLKLQNGFNPGNVEIFNGTLVLTPEGGIKADAEIHAKAISVEKVSVLGASTTSSEDSEGIEEPSDSTVGEGILSAGLLEVTIANTNVTPESKVFITPVTDTDDKSLVISSKIDGAFTVKIKTTVASDIKFDYWILGVEEGSQ